MLPQPRSKPSPRRRTQRPPKPPLYWASAALLITLLCFWGGPLSAPGRNIVGFCVGSVLGFVLLGWFSVADNHRRLPRVYQDWGIPSRLLVRSVCLACWVLGLAHCYFWALDLTRML